MNSKLHRRCLLAAGLLCFTLTGCGGGADTAQYTVVQPETLSLDGSEWKKVAWSTSLDSTLSKHFRKAPELTENPSLNGETVCYTSGSKKRVYWLSSAGDTCQWAMVEFNGSRGSELVEGVGEPFLQLKAVDE